MTIDWTNFTPWTSLAGGILIGLAAALMILMNGRVAGVSGIVGGLLSPRPNELAWRLAFIAGLIAAPLIYALFAPLPPMRVVASGGALIAAGLLVGVGTRYASGCTSGHGVCGFARRSPRSMAATAAFMLAGFVTVYIIRHLL
jgi:uncharacterized membrane protein YedE/YeeE